MRILGMVGIVIASAALYLGGIALVAFNARLFIGVDQAEICRRAIAILPNLDAGAIDQAPAPSPADLVPTDPGPSFPNSLGVESGSLNPLNMVDEAVPEATAWHRELVIDGFEGGWVRTWSFQGLDLGAKVEQFASHQQALDYEAWLATDVTCQYSNEVFTGTVPGSIGFQVRYRAGAPGEQVTFIRGSRRYTVSVSGPSAPADHTSVDRLAGWAARVAR